ncbi:MAG: gliding motility-associated C-terminal domain-containing protein [Bacteroidota bacterium]
MKPIFFYFFIFLFFYRVTAQVNLVPNYSFEDTIQCPNATGQINKCANWYNPNTASPDYFNSCTANASVGVPQNAFGYQNARTGKAYAGIYVYNKPVLNVREYIQVQLADSLKKSSVYCVSFYVCLDNRSNTAITQLGLYLSNNSLTSSNYLVFNVTPQIMSQPNQFLNDSINWVRVFGFYLAKGGERFITIGNFKTDANTDTTNWDLNNPNCFPFCASVSYYYIDDVSLMPSVEASAGIDTTICKGNNLTIGSVPVTGITYNWQPAAGLSNNTLAQPLAAPMATTTYILTISDTTGKYCISKAIDTITINVNNATVTLGNDLGICEGQTKTLDAGNAGAVYLWSTTATTQTITVNEPGTYWVAVNKNGCITEDTINISLKSCDTSYIQFPLPNTFSPNGDGINDVVKITTKNIKDFKWEIYNRWGILVWSSSPLGRLGGAWDGKTTAGTECVDGVYYYILSATGLDGKEYNEKGFIQLITSP